MNVQDDRKNAAKELVDYHVQVEDEIVSAFLYVRSGGDELREPIKILEVSRATIPAGIIPVYFGKTKESPPVAIIEITEEEYLDVQGGKLKLPIGWDHPTSLYQKAA